MVGPNEWNAEEEGTKGELIATTPRAKLGGAEQHRVGAEPREPEDEQTQQQ